MVVKSAAAAATSPGGGNGGGCARRRRSFPCLFPPSLPRPFPRCGGELSSWGEEHGGTHRRAGREPGLPAGKSAVRPAGRPAEPVRTSPPKGPPDPRIRWRRRGSGRRARLPGRSSGRPSGGAGRFGPSLIRCRVVADGEGPGCPAALRGEGLAEPCLAQIFGPKLMWEGA